ncbi:MAG: peptidylprolyl isomerase [Bryobacteraceae bacterium]
MRNSLHAAVSILILAGCGGPAGQETETKKQGNEPKAPPPAEYKVKVDTTKGVFVIQVHRDWSPTGADHFHRLVSSNFYDGVKFHRVLKQFIAQWGINGNPQTHQLYAMVRISDDPPKQKNKRGAVAFAKIGPNSRTTEVFVNLRDNRQLDATGFVPFGEVVEGMDVVDSLTYLYGDLAPRGAGPDPIKAQQVGNVYLERDFPRLDAIKTARVVQ